MAIVKGPFQITGSVSGLSFYTRRDSDKVIMRTKGGANADKIKKLPQYEGFRNQQKEWSGCTKLVSAIRMALGGLHRAADYNITATLNGVANKMQKAHSEGEKGMRPVLLSSYTHWIAGFNFNRRQVFNSVLGVSLQSGIDRDALKGTVSFPYINTATDLQNLRSLPYFRLIIALGTVSDMAYDANSSDYRSLVPEIHGASFVTESAWFPAVGVVQPFELTVEMPERLKAHLQSAVSVLLTVAVEFGSVGYDGQPAAVKYAASGKILAVG